VNKEDLVLKKIKSVELKTKKLVSALNLGDYKSAMKGQGMTFSDFREYVPGDDVRNISWTSIAKTNKPYVKQFEEERELGVYFLMDTSYSMYSGTKGMLKIEMAMYVMASIAMSAQKNNDLSGLILFSKNMELFVNPKKGQSHVRRLITEVIKFKPYSTSSEGLNEACNMLLEHQKKKSVVFVFSDFLNLSYNKKIFQSLAKKHQIIACVMKDPSMNSKSFSKIGNFQISNALESLTLNTSWLSVRKIWDGFFDTLTNRQNSFLKSSAVDQIEFFTDKDFYKPLVMYFKRKSRS
jgi:uncharacterized protein (DUF58 family)